MEETFWKKISSLSGSGVAVVLHRGFDFYCRDFDAGDDVVSCVGDVVLRCVVEDQRDPN